MRNQTRNIKKMGKHQRNATSEPTYFITENISCSFNSDYMCKFRKNFVKNWALVLPCVKKVTNLLMVYNRNL